MSFSRFPYGAYGVALLTNVVLFKSDIASIWLYCLTGVGFVWLTLFALLALCTGMAMTCTDPSFQSGTP